MGFKLKNRTDAGRQLAAALSGYRDVPDLLILALPRGGVPVAYEIARELRAELDILMVRKLGVPFHPELAMGAIASGGARVFNPDVIRDAGVTQLEVDAIVEREQADLARGERQYRGTDPWPEVRDRTLIVVDDGVATAASMLAAVQALRTLKPARIIVAAPVAPLRSIRELKAAADDCVYLAAPRGFGSVGEWYRDFAQVTDEEVIDYLKWARRNHADKRVHA